MTKEIINRIEVLIDNIHKLGNTCIPNHDLKIDYLTLFSKNDADYEYLQNELKQLGNEQDANNGKKYTLSEPLAIDNENITLIRVRKPDIHRSEIGCCDFSHTEEIYKDIRKQALEKGWDIILRKGYEMIELSTFELPVYAYLVLDTD